VVEKQLEGGVEAVVVVVVVEEEVEVALVGAAVALVGTGRTQRLGLVVQEL